MPLTKPGMGKKNESSAPGGKSGESGHHMNIEDIQKLMDMLSKSNIHELELEMAGARLKLLKHQQVGAPHAALVHANPQPPQQANPAPAPLVIQQAPDVQLQVAAEAPQREPAAARLGSNVEVKSPMVGTFYRSPSPGAEPFVKIGDRVKKGQTVCIIEAMKLFNEIEAESDGVIVDILVENAQPVEYGERLMLMEPGS